MLARVLLPLAFLSSMALADSPCGAELSPVNGVPHLLVSDGSVFSLFRCPDGACGEALGTESAPVFVNVLVGGMQMERQALDTITECVQKRALADDDDLIRLEREGGDTAAMAGRLQLTKLELRRLGARLDALKALAGSPRERFLGRPVSLWLTAEIEPLLYRLALAAFGLRP